MAKKEQRKIRDDADVPKVTLKDFREVSKLTLTDYAGPFSSADHPEYGESYLLNLDDGGSKKKLFLNQKSAAGKVFFKAVDSGRLSIVDMGGTMELIFRPKAVEGSDNIMVELRFGKATVKQESAPF
jgi:hypothetical protein